MLFNSYVFIFAFAPIVFAGTFALGRFGRSVQFAWLIVSALIFYGWQEPWFVTILVLSVAMNLAIGTAIIAKQGRWLLLIGVALNLALLFTFKYLGFAEGILRDLFGWPNVIVATALPLGISFYTFTQIAFLVDAHRGEIEGYGPLRFALFVTYFPHLIAGPIIHHKEIIPQFDEKQALRFNSTDAALGLSIFAIGLVKKTLLADGLAPTANAIFAAASDLETPITFIDAWIGAFSYAFQIYFDFSGYCDMAIGLSLIIGIRLPINFNSPYKATSIIEFWRRWHMTLSRFLRDYLYIPLGGNRGGSSKRYFNLMLTMLLGGLWHGAAWTFVAWGALHGLYLLINHAWRELVKIPPNISGSIGYRQASRFVTFIAVVLAWVFFKSDNLSAALRLLGTMAVPEISSRGQPISTLLLAALVAWLAPNSQEITANWRPALGHYTASRLLRWQPSPFFAFFSAIGLALGIMGISNASTFIYFNF
jgi:D-alanyl-lipoteichoic acid acyltransferase DltB (MBOAT superfamily)